MVDYVKFPEAVLNLKRWVYGANQVAEIEQQLGSIPGTDGDLAQAMPEIMYAHYDLLDDGAKRVMAETFLCLAAGPHPTATAGAPASVDRSLAIAAQVGRELGDEGAIQPLPHADWPEPQATRRNGWDWRFENGVRPALADPAPGLPAPAE